MYKRQTFTYTPDQFFIGTDTFVYEISDPSGLTAQATVTIDVTSTIDFDVVKTQVGGPNPITAVGQDIDYEIVVTNNSDIPLTNVSAVDTLPDGSTGTLSGPTETGATEPTPPVDGQLDVDEVWTYTITYTTTQADLDAGTDLVNTIAIDTDQTEEQTVTAQTPVTQPAPGIVITKSADLVKAAGNTDPDAQVGDTINYTYLVENTGGLTLTDIDIDDVHGGSGPFPDPSGETLDTDVAPTGDSTDTGGSNNGVWDTLAPGDIVEFTASYTVTQTDIDNQ